MNRLRWGIIGLGFFGEKHAEVLATLPEVELAAVCTRRTERVKEIAERFGVGKTYTDYHQLLADKSVDVVSVVAHVEMHRELAVAALQAGKHVFLEKPLAGSVGDCDAIVAAAGQARGRLMVGHVCRFDPRVALAKAAIAEGRLGRIVSLHATRNLSADISAGVLDKISPLMGDGVHDTDLMLWFTGARVEKVYAQNVRVRNFRHPDIGWAMLSFAGGAVGVIETVWHLPSNTQFAIDARLEVIGTTGALYLDCGNAGLTINDAGGWRKPDTAYWPNLHGQRIGALRHEFEYFINCLHRGEAPSVITVTEARAAVAVMAAAETSAASGQPVAPAY